jgi:hypothetical protein
MGNEGIIADHPTLKLKYLDPEMARLALELKRRLDKEMNQNVCEGEWRVGDAYPDEILEETNSVTIEPSTGSSKEHTQHL